MNLRLQPAVHDFVQMRARGLLYVDKTRQIRDFWIGIRLFCLPVRGVLARACFCPRSRPCTSKNVISLRQLPLTNPLLPFMMLSYGTGQIPRVLCLPWT